METKVQRRLPLGKLMWGVILMTLGVLFTLHNTEYIDIGNIKQFWPFILIAMGIIRVIQPEFNRQRSSGVWLLMIGSCFLIGSLGLFGLDYGSAWPLLIVAVGAGLIWESLSRQQRREKSGEENGTN